MRKIVFLILSFFLMLKFTNYVFADEQLLKTYEELFPTLLNEEEIRQQIFIEYEEFDIVRITIEEIKGIPQKVEHEEKKVVANKDNALGNFPVTIPYDENGYVGELKRLDNTLIVKENETSNTNTETEQVETFYYYSLDNNDVSYIDKNITKDGISMKLKSLKFVISSYRDVAGAKVPNTYDAIAKYSYSYNVSGQSIKNYTASITYSNELAKINNYKALITVVDDEKMQKNKSMEQELEKHQMLNTADDKELYIEQDKQVGISESETITEKLENDNINKKKTNINFKKILEHLQTIFLIIVVVIIICFMFFAMYKLIYLILNHIIVYNKSNGEAVLLGRTRITKKSNGYYIDLTGFMDKSKSSVYKIVFSKKDAKKFSGIPIYVALIVGNKKFVRQIKINYKQTIESYEYDISF